MGSSSSSQRVVFENDDSGVVQLSDSVVKRLQGQEGSAPSCDDSCSVTGESAERQHHSDSSPADKDGLHGRLHPEDMADACRQMEATYFDRLKVMEERIANVEKVTHEQFTKAVNEVEQKFMKVKCSPVCQDLQNKVYECYLVNRSKTLACSSQVKDFSSCVEHVRQNALCKEG